MRRTVIERVIPPPRSRMTVPSKTWMRSRLPSTTLADTFTVSPVASSGRSVRSWSWTISSSTFTRRFLGRGEAARRCGQGRTVAARDATAPEYSTGSGLVRGQQVGPTRPGPVDGLLVTPTGDRAVVPGGQDDRDRRATELRRAGVVRILEEAAAERLLRGGQ